jgi:hypothetical protein
VMEPGKPGFFYLSKNNYKIIKIFSQKMLTMRIVYVILYITKGGKRNDIHDDNQR